MPASRSASPERLAQGFEADAFLPEQRAQWVARQHPVFMLARLGERVLGVGAHAGVAHPQITAAAGRQPVSCPTGVAFFTAGEVVDPQQVIVLAKALCPRLSRQCGSPQGFQEPGFQRFPPGPCWRLWPIGAIARGVSQPRQTPRVTVVQLSQ